MFAPITTLPAKAEQFTSGNWQAECAIDAMTDRTGCLVKLPLVQRTPPPGAFALVVGPGYISLVGESRLPIGFAQMRVDKNPALTCKGGTISCDFSPSDSAVLAQELASGTQVLIRIATLNAVFDFSNWAVGYRECLTAISRWGFSLNAPVSPPPRRQ